MRVRSLCCAVALAVGVLSSCGGSDDEPSVADSVAPADNADSGAEAPDTAAAEAPAGTGDCSTISGDEIARHGVSTQLIAQLIGQPQVDAVKDGIVGEYDPAVYDATLADLHALLDGHPVAPFGDPKDDLDFYGAVNEIAAEMLAVDGPVPADLFERYTTLTNGGTDVIMRQTSIGAALEEVCPDLAQQAGA